MKRRTTKLKTQTEDKRGVAIYARKSVITHKGDSTGVQIKQSSDYACSQLSLPQDYDFTIYMDKGLSGYYSDRPDFQRMLKDIELHKIRAVVCYKLDRISRKTSDLLRLMDFFDKYHVVLLVCSNNINTNISTSKIMISFLAIIAEFERDILTERVTDNLVELSKDGRWMGGTEPTGYDRYRVSVGTGKNKTAVTHLKTIPEEKKMVVDIYETFLRRRSLNQATKEIRTRWKTKRGLEHTTISLKTILRNPTYCIADQYAYEYFYDNNASICMEDKFDGTHGISTYNRRSEMKVEHDDSTFFKPKFTSVHVEKDIEEWLVSVGQHEGFISGKDWVRTQFLLDDLADKFNRPHQVSHALLAGKVYCPTCGRRMQVFAESDRLNEDGTMRFKYGCPNQRVKKTCTQKSIRGKELDDFVNSHSQRS